MVAPSQALPETLRLRAALLALAGPLSELVDADLGSLIAAARVSAHASISQQYVDEVISELERMQHDDSEARESVHRGVAAAGDDPDWSVVVVREGVPPTVVAWARWRPRQEPGLRAEVEGELTTLASQLPASLIARVFAQVVESTTGRVLDAVGITIAVEAGTVVLGFNCILNIPVGWRADEVMVTMSASDPLAPRRLDREQRRIAQRQAARVFDERRVPGGSLAHDSSVVVNTRGRPGAPGARGVEPRARRGFRFPEQRAAR